MGWAGKRNGELLRLMIAERFAAILTVDQNLEFQQNIRESRIAVVVGAALLGCLVLLAPCVAAAQTTDASATPSNAVMTSFLDWEAAVAYPGALAIGGSFSVGRSRLATIPGRGRAFRGVEVAASAGLGSADARVSWVDYVAYDAGLAGWSIDAVYVRPWAMSWGMADGDSYIGAGASWLFGYLRMSGALVTNASSSERQVVPTAQVAILMPPW
jgi:hypothetical protein